MTIVLIIAFFIIGLLVAWIACRRTTQTCRVMTQKDHHNPLSHLFPGVLLPAATQQQAIYDLIRKGYPILENGDIQTWMVGGTLLGAVRCKPGGIIPWDDDVDLGYNDQQTEQLQQLRPRFDKEGLALTETWFGFKIHPIGSDPKVPPFLDLFPTSFLPDGTTEFARPRARAIWKPEKESFRGTEMLFPLRKYRFGKTFLKGPQNPRPYLLRKFGPGWKYRAVIDPPHLPAMCSEFRHNLERKNITLSQSQRVSALDE